MKKKLRIGVMGCASIAERMVIPAILKNDNFELVTVCSRSYDKAKEFALKFNCEFTVGYENLISRNDINCIYMPLPTGLHFEFAIKVLNSGKHLLVEKSIATNYMEAVEIINSAKRNRVLVKENFMFEYHKQFSTIQTILKSNAIGELRCLRSSFGFPPFIDKTNIRYSKDLGGGALLDAGAYTVKISSLILGEKLQIIGAVSKFDAKLNVDITGGVLMSNSNGCLIETAFGFDNFYQCELQIWGSKGKITADRIFTAGPFVKAKLELENKEGNETIIVENDNHFFNLIEHFAAIVNSGNFEMEYDAILLQSNLLEKIKDKSIKFYE
jgi:predicted dehydrogenase